MANMASLQIRHMFHRSLEERWVPETEQDPWYQISLPIGETRYCLVHEPKEALRIIVHFNVDIERDLSVLGLCESSGRFSSVNDTPTSSRRPNV